MVTGDENDVALASEPTSTPTKRLRWATQYRNGKSANRKRVSIMNRLHQGSHSSKKGDSGTKSVGANNILEDPNEDTHLSVDSENQGRKIHFNIPLPPDAVDENGYPKESYARNKIRTTKYTPLSFIPKNLWFQFQTIANVYFFILIILTVSLDGVFLYCN